MIHKFLKNSVLVCFLLSVVCCFAKMTFESNPCKRVDYEFNISMIYPLTSCNTKERIVQNIYIRNSNRNYRKIKLSIYNNDYNNNINLEMVTYKNCFS